MAKSAAGSIIGECFASKRMMVRGCQGAASRSVEKGRTE
jgi:hypothetical protein